MRRPKILFCTKHLVILHSHRLSINISPSLFHPHNLYHTSIANSLELLLPKCTTPHHLKQLHSHIILTGATSSPFLTARLIAFYSHFSLLTHAQTLFSHTPIASKSNILLWNSVLRANLSHSNFQQVLHLFSQLRRTISISPDTFTFPLVIRASASLRNVNLCKTVHSHAIFSGFGFHLHSANELIRMYAKIGDMDSADQVFDRMYVRTYISWNSMVSGFAENYDFEGGVKVFERMELEGVEPNLVTWTSLLSAHARCGQHERVMSLFVELRRRKNEANAEAVAVVLSVCADMDAFLLGKGVHGYVVRGGFGDYVFVKNSLVRVYGKQGNAEDAMGLFNEIKVRSLVSWNVLISSFVEAGLCDKALEAFFLLGKSEDSMVRPNVVSWSAIIGAFASKKGQEDESLDLFRAMVRAGVTPNSVTIVTVLSVCATLAALNLGREVHGYVVRGSMDKNILVGNGMINMYTKCGGVKEGRSVFDMIQVKDLISWNSMISGYGMHGFGEDALTTFDDMLREGIQPDGITFVALLSACSHVGLVVKGRRLFDHMINKFFVPPQMEHYACMVDLLGRAGLLQEASEIVKMMNVEPNTCVWGALLNSCKIHKNTEVAEQTASQIFGLESDITGSYMLLSNLYAVSGRWEDSAKVRMLAKGKGLKKSPGQSWIEVKKKMYLFSSGNYNSSQSGLKQVSNIFLKDLVSQMETEGYKPDMSFVLQDVDEEEKKQILSGHSEKLAIVFGHVNIPPNMPIRVIKNLRVCGDCHKWTKFFSKVTKRIVIVRDGRRFHHFINGSCSCKDYW